MRLKLHVQYSRKCSQTVRIETRTNQPATLARHL